MTAARPKQPSRFTFPVSIHLQTTLVKLELQKICLKLRYLDNEKKILLSKNKTYLMNYKINSKDKFFSTEYAKKQLSININAIAAKAKEMEALKEKFSKLIKIKELCQQLTPANESETVGSQLVVCKQSDKTASNPPAQVASAASKLSNPDASIAKAVNLGDFKQGDKAPQHTSTTLFSHKRKKENKEFSPRKKYQFQKP